MFRRLGEAIARRPLVVVAAWLVAVVAIQFAKPDAERVAAAEPHEILPASAESSRARALARSAFPDAFGRSRAVLVFDRAEGLTADDFAHVAAVAARLRDAAAAHDNWAVLAPGDSPLHRQRLVSADGQCALLVVLLDANWTTKRCAQLARDIEEIAAPGLPAGLTCELTGSAGAGRDYSDVSAGALNRTTSVTILLVVIILAIVYRAPLAALVPLASITCSVIVALGLLDILAGLHWGISDREKVFTVVLLYGAGTDYALFWISRYREAIAAGEGQRQAIVSAMQSTGPAVAASAGTTIIGLATMMVAELVPTHNAGRVMAIVLLIAFLAATTLAPALVALMGRALFWPSRSTRQTEFGMRRMWIWLATRVTRHPAATLAIGVLLMLPPIWTATHIEYEHDSLGQLPADRPAARGAAIVEHHFPAGELYPTTLLVELPAAVLDRGDARDIAQKLEDACASVASVADVRGLTRPAGRSRSADVLNLTAGAFGRDALEHFYVSRKPPVMRIEFVTAFPPLSVQAMDTVRRATSAVAAAASAMAGGRVTVLSEGTTPYISDVREITRRDRRWVMVLAPLLIWVIVIALIRDFWLSVFMILATLMTFEATMGLTQWTFVGLLGASAIDWKVDLFVFVIIVAIGQDYNIFLVTRLLQEARGHALQEAAHRAIVRTGAIISSCGLIMAATLGSLMSADLWLYQQLGFALAAGILIDTFLVRPLLIPSFYLITHRRRRPAAGVEPAPATPEPATAAIDRSPRGA